MQRRVIPIEGLAVFLLATLIISSCAQIEPMMEKLDPRGPFYESFNGKYLNQVNTSTWQPLPDRETDVSNDDFGSKIKGGYYLPKNGITVARLDDGVVDIPSMKVYLEGICRKLLESSPKSDIPVKVVISDSSGYGDVQVTPDGTIIVSLGAISAAQTEDELAWLLGHEIAHLILEHHDADWVRLYGEQMMGTANTALQFANSLDTIRQEFNREMGIDNSSRGAADTVDKQAKRTRNVHNINVRGILPAWNRRQEDQADLLGIDLASKAGYDVEQSATALSKIRAWAQEEEDIFNKIVEIDELHYQRLQNATAASFGDTIVQMWRQAKTSWNDNSKSALARTHRLAKYRLEAVNGYLDREYAVADVDAYSVKLSAQKKKYQYRNAVKSYKVIWDIQNSLWTKLLGKKDLGKLASKVIANLSSRIASDSRPRLVLSNIRDRQEKTTQAIANLKSALKGKYPSYLVYKTLAEYYMDAKQLKSAERTLNEAWNELEHPPQLYPLRIRQKVLSDNLLEASDLVAECEVRASPFAKVCRLELDTVPKKVQN